MHPWLRKFFGMNWLVFGLMLALLAYGIYAIYSATWMRNENFWSSQLVWLCLCLPMYFIVSLVDYRWVRFGAVPLYVLGILGLVATMLIVAIAIVPLVVNFGLKPYQYSRITTFLNPDLDPQGDGWNINQSLIAIGSGGFYGKGFKAPNTQNELGFLPATIVHNDFIFSVMGEQHGFVGGIILLAVLTMLFLAALHIAVESDDDLGRLLAVGIVMLLFTHTFMNIGMTISVTPITGLPLPFISYGGSFLMITLFSMGLLQSVWIHRKTIR